MKLQKNPEDWNRSQIVAYLMEMAEDYEAGLPLSYLDSASRREWSLCRAAAAMLADDEQRIHQLNEALLRAKGQ